MVDEVMVWRKALSEEDVKKSMEPADKLFAVHPLTKLAATWGSIKK